MVAVAREYGINLSKTCGDALALAVKREHERCWQEDNRQWIDAHRHWVENNELPLERDRLF